MKWLGIITPIPYANCVASSIAPNQRIDFQLGPESGSGALRGKERSIALCCTALTLVMGLVPMMDSIHRWSGTYSRGLKRLIKRL